MPHQKKINQQHSSFWQKVKSFITNLTHNQKDESDDGQQDSGSSGRGKLKGQGFIDPKAATLKDQQTPESSQQYVKNLETVLYDELKKDPAAMQALKELVNGQIPSAKAVEAYEKVKNSTVALETIANSEYAPSDVKAKAREELAQQQRKKLAAQPGFKKEPPRPRGM